MPHPQALLARLDQIAASLSDDSSALALIAFGSVGLETSRLDAYSDLDFFVIVRSGRKAAFLSDLSWMSRPCPVAYAFQNTADGYKLLYEDGIFAEFAVFEPQELSQVAFAPGRLVWSTGELDPEVASPRLSLPAPHSLEWIVGEALTNLYTGLGRYRRGENLSAQRFIQGYAVDRLLELVDRLDPHPSGDPFTPARRFEARYPRLVPELSAWLPGYDAILQSASAILSSLESRVEVNPAMKSAILALIEEDKIQ